MCDKLRTPRRPPSIFGARRGEIQDDLDPVSISAPTSWCASVGPCCVTAAMLTFRLGPHCSIELASPEMQRRCPLPSSASGSSSSLMIGAPRVNGSEHFRAPHLECGPELSFGNERSRATDAARREAYLPGLPVLGTRSASTSFRRNGAAIEHWAVGLNGHFGRYVIEDVRIRGKAPL